MDKRIGAQIFTIRDFCQTAEDFEKSMEKLAKIGYKQIQISAVGPIAPEIIKGSCDRHEMIITCTHRGFSDYENNVEGEIKFHKALNCNIAGLGMIPGEFYPNESFTKESIRDFIKRANVITEKLAAEGITFAYHNHALEFEKADGKFIYDYMIEEGKFDFIVDVYWMAFAGINPSEYIEKLGSRAVCVHFKDLAVKWKSAYMTEVGNGNLSWDKIIASCEKAGTKYALVEQDICQCDPFESMKISYDFLTKKGFE